LLRLLAFQPAGQRALAEKKSLKRAAEPAAVAAAPLAPPPPAPAPLPPPIPSPAPAQAPVPAPATAQVQAPVPVPPMATVPVRLVPSPVLRVPVVDEPRTPTTPVSHSANAMPALEGKGTLASTVVPFPVRTAPEPTRADLSATTGLAAPVSATAEGDFWHGLVLAMVKAETVGALVRELALQSQLLARDDSAQPPEPSHWQLRVENATLNQPGTRDRLQNALAQHGHAVKLAVEVGTVSDTPARRQAAAAAQRQQEAERSIRRPWCVTLAAKSCPARSSPSPRPPEFHFNSLGIPCSTKDNSLVS